MCEYTKQDLQDFKKLSEIQDKYSVNNHIDTDEFKFIIDLASEAMALRLSEKVNMKYINWSQHFQ